MSSLYPLDSEDELSSDEDDLGIAATDAQITASRSQSSLLLKVPAELCDRIFEYAVTEDDEIDIREARRPSLTEANRQTRQEALLLYFHSNSFIAFVSASEYCSVLLWLRSLTDEERRHVKKVTIACQNLNLWNMEDARGPKPELRHWHHLIFSLSTLGLRGSQIHWPGVPHIDLMSDTSGENKGSITYLITQRFLFNNFILKPLLASHAMLDESNLPTDLLQIAEMVADTIGMSTTGSAWNNVKKWANATMVYFLNLCTKDGRSPDWYQLYVKSLARERAKLVATQNTVQSMLNKWDAQKGPVTMSEDAVTGPVFSSTVDSWRLDHVLLSDKVRTTALAEARKNMLGSIELSDRPTNARQKFIFESDHITTSSPKRGNGTPDENLTHVLQDGSRAFKEQWDCLWKLDMTRYPTMREKMRARHNRQK